MATGNVKNRQPDKVKSLILHKIREKEVGLQNELRKNYDKGLFESALYLQNVKSSLKNGDKIRWILFDDGKVMISKVKKKKRN